MKADDRSVRELDRQRTEQGGGFRIDQLADVRAGRVFAASTFLPGRLYAFST
jgi:hypothetical protein